MLNAQLINPKSIVVIGASNDVRKPGGKMLKNIIDGGYKGGLYVVNPKAREVQDIPSFEDVTLLPEVDLAILAIPAAYCIEAIHTLLEKGVKAFIIISAGFSEATEAGRRIEEEITRLVDEAGASLIGPNCIGVLNRYYHGVFTTPIPMLDPKGCDLISGSGATAVFIMEAGLSLGLKFNSVFSVGNGAQTAVEDVLEYMDLHYDPETDAPVKLLYLETIKDPQKLFKHASSLIRKGARIAAIKAGVTQAGSRAAASHTGAIMTSDRIIRALFKKAGIVYCSSREELLSVASIFNYKQLKGPNIAVITHAGGSAVMLADALSKGGLNIPKIEGPQAEKLLTYLHDGASVSNPIDFLATGTAEQLGIIIDYCEHKFEEIDGMIVVFGSPGLFDVENVYNVLSVKLDVCTKPIYPVLPSVINARKEIQGFIEEGHINFPDEVVLGTALPQVYYTTPPVEEEVPLPEVDQVAIRRIIESAESGFLDNKRCNKLLEAAGIPIVKEFMFTERKVFEADSNILPYPVVMKVQGPLHKTEVGGVVLDIQSQEEAIYYFDKLMQIEGVEGVVVQPMLIGLELYVGAKREEGFGHVVLCGLGGIFIEVLQDVQATLSPVSQEEAVGMIEGLKGRRLLDGYRGGPIVDVASFVDIIRRISALVEAAPEIIELDINPLKADDKGITAVDARIAIA